ncbi:hypothetical protein F8388_010542 [Cannabis sativa]|uniref:Uncharacterized protein n=1 Tax=Cannabis sativa TaxID=3483 RepID=A0A7J6GMT4_CANSA|nr:hypothetical protein G4B88_016811 [Cannabis sativa]KAF4384944.1 hypothetical protein F8388_010542 [Cannabis sativa]
MILFSRISSSALSLNAKPLRFSSAASPLQTTVRIHPNHLLFSRLDGGLWSLFSREFLRTASGGFCVPSLKASNGEAVIGGGEKKLHKKNPVAHDGKNRRALGDIGNMVPAARGGVEGKPNHPMTRVFMFNYLLTLKTLELLRRTRVLKQMVVPDDGRRIEALEANKINKIVNVKPKPIEAIDLSSNTEKVKKKPEKPLNNMEKEVEVGGGALRKKAPTLTPVLTARSKAQIVDIHATDVDNKLERQIDTVFSYTRLCKAFVSACTHILGLEGTPEGVEDQGKLTRVAVVELQFPIGINSDRFVRALKIPEVQEHMKELKERFAGRKSICNQKLTRQVHEIVGHINGRFETLTAVPIHHLDYYYAQKYSMMIQQSDVIAAATATLNLGSEAMADVTFSAIDVVFSSPPPLSPCHEPSFNAPEDGLVLFGIVDDDDEEEEELK